MFGTLDVERNGDLTDVTKTEILTFAPLFVMVFVMGIYPQPFLSRMEPAVEQQIDTIKMRAARLSERDKSPQLRVYALHAPQDDEQHDDNRFE